MDELWARPVGLAALFVVAGVLHFVVPRFYLKMMPPYIPFHRAAVAVSGVAEIGLGVGLLFPEAQRWAAIGLIALLVAVFPANLFMAQHPERFPAVPRWGLWLRLPLQAVLIGWVWLYAR